MGKGSWVAGIVAGLVLVALPAAAGKIQRYTDDEGTLHIIDSEPAGAKTGPGSAVTAPPPARMVPGSRAPRIQPPPEPEPPEEGEEAPEAPPGSGAAPEVPESEGGEAAFRVGDRTRFLLALAGER